MKVKVIANYTMECKDKNECANLALHHFHAELEKWKNKKDFAQDMFEFEVTE